MWYRPPRSGRDRSRISTRPVKQVGRVAVVPVLAHRHEFHLAVPAGMGANSARHFLADRDCDDAHRGRRLSRRLDELLPHKNHDECGHGSLVVSTLRRFATPDIQTQPIAGHCASLKHPSWMRLLAQLPGTAQAKGRFLTFPKRWGTMGHSRPWQSPRKGGSPAERSFLVACLKREQLRYCNRFPRNSDNSRSSRANGRWTRNSCLEKSNEYTDPPQNVSEQIFLFLDVAGVCDAGGLGFQPHG
jgi:hypothetical protein